MSDLVIDVFRKNSTELTPLPTTIEPVISPLPGIEALVFDIYGTLFISGSGDVGHASANPKAKCLEDTALACEFELTDAPENVLNDFYDAIRDSHRRSKDAGNEYPEVDILEIWKQALGSIDEETLIRFAVEFESRSNPVWPMPSLDGVLSELAGRIPLGIISNAQFFTLDLFEVFLNVPRSELGFQAELEVFSFEEGMAKPGKRIYEIATDRLTKQGLRPENVLYVGNDMLNDIWGAKAVGFQTGLFAGDERSLRLRNDDSRVDGLNPDIIVKDLSQIVDCIDLPNG